jgi:putative membrane-bound dehydrogenase-like protein
VKLAPLALLLATCATPAPPAPRVPSNDITPEFDVAPGLEVREWARSPDLFNPTAIDVDARGRLWVTEAVNYRQWDGRNPGKHHDAGDRVMILEDTDGDGVCDSSKVFVQDPDLVAPLGIAVIGKQVVVSCSPSIFVYTDEDGDDRSDKREVFLTGFGGHDHDHGVHSVVVGPDGRWYLAVGNAGPHLVKGNTGLELRSGSIYTGGGEFEADNAPGLLSSDGRVYTGGLMLRADAFGSSGANLKVMAHNFRNPYEIALDSFGNMYTSDNDDDGNQACRTTWVMEGGNYGFFSADGSRTWQADERPGQSTVSAHWHQDDPGVMPAGSITGAGGPTGVVVYEGDLLGDELRGAVLSCDAGRNLVFSHRPSVKGAGIELERGLFLAARSRGDDDRDARWFRPSDVCVGVDGSIFVSDWWDPGVGGHQAGDAEAFGRILRIAPKRHRARVPRVDTTTVKGAVAALKSPAVNVRALGAAALREFGERATPELLALWNGDDAILRARALWCLARATHDVVALGVAPDDPDERIAAAGIRAARAAGRTAKEIAEFAPHHDSRAPLVKHASPAVRGQIANAFCESGGELRVSAVVELARAYEAGDRTMLEAIGAAADYDAEGIAKRLESVLGAAPLEWSEAYADLMWRLHPAHRTADFVARAHAAELPSFERKRAVDALAFIGTRAAALAMLDVAQTGPEDVRELAAWWIGERDANEWREYHLATQLGPRGREGARRCFASGILESGSVDIDVDITGATQLWLVVDDGKNGNGHDWADWIEPRVAGPAGEIQLSSSIWMRASAGWGSVHVGKNANSGPLAIGGKQYANGIGTHAESEIVFAIPAGYTRFTATAGVDDGGALQSGAHPELEFEVYTDAPPDRTAQRALEAQLASDSTSDAELADAVERLCADRDGALALIEMARDGKLTPRAKPMAAERIFRHEDLAVRALASEQFERPAASGARLPPVTELARVPGRADAGSRLFFSPKAGCSTCHTFQKRGGDLGPDLTAIAQKFGRIEILDAMLNPSAAIALGYDTWIVETTDGEIVSGFLLGSGDAITIKDTSGRRRFIAADEVVSRHKLKVSTMPDNVALGLAPQELADIVSFLQSDPTAPGAPDEKRALFNGKDLTGWTFHLDDPKARMEDVWSVENGVIRCRGTPNGYLRTEEDFDNFILTLDWRWPEGSTPGNSGVLLRMVGPDQVWPKSMEAQLHSGDAGDIWNIGDFPMEADRARTSGRRTRKLEPSNERAPGQWNRYEIRLDGGNLSLRVNGVEQNVATWCDPVAGKICLQSEGAPIEFRNIEIRPIRRPQ